MSKLYIRRTSTVLRKSDIPQPFVNLKRNIQDKLQNSRNSPQSGRSIKLGDRQQRLVRSRRFRSRIDKGCSGNYPQGGGPQALFCPVGGRVFCWQRVRGVRGLTCPGGSRRIWSILGQGCPEGRGALTPCVSWGWRCLKKMRPPEDNFWNSPNEPRCYGGNLAYIGYTWALTLPL